MFNGEIAGLFCDSRIEPAVTGFYRRRLLTPSFYNLADPTQPDIYNDDDANPYGPDDLDPFHSELLRLIQERNEPKNLPPGTFGFGMDCVDIKEPFHLYSPAQIRQLLRKPDQLSKVETLGYRIETIGNIDRYYR